MNYGALVLMCAMVFLAAIVVDVAFRLLAGGFCQ